MNKLKPFIIIFIILILAAGVVLAYKFFSQKQQAPAEATPPIEVPQTNPFEEVKTNPFKDIKTNPFE